MINQEMYRSRKVGSICLGKWGCVILFLSLGTVLILSGCSQDEAQSNGQADQPNKAQSDETEAMNYHLQAREMTANVVELAKSGDATDEEIVERLQELVSFFEEFEEVAQRNPSAALHYETDKSFADSYVVREIAGVLDARKVPDKMIIESKYQCDRISANSSKPTGVSADKEYSCSKSNDETIYYATLKEAQMLRKNGTYYSSNSFCELDNGQTGACVEASIAIPINQEIRLIEAWEINSDLLWPMCGKVFDNRTYVGKFCDQLSQVTSSLSTTSSKWPKSLAAAKKLIEDRFGFVEEVIEYKDGTCACETRYY